MDEIYKKFLELEIKDNSDVNNVVIDKEEN